MYVCVHPSLFFLTGPGGFLLRLSPGLPLAPDPWLTPGCCRTLSRVVFLMAAGEMRSWSARNCSSLRRRGGGKSACLCVSGFRCVSPPTSPCPDTRSLHGVDEQTAESATLHHVQGVDGGSPRGTHVVLQLARVQLRVQQHLSCSLWVKEERQTEGGSHHQSTTKPARASY